MNKDDVIDPLTGDGGILAANPSPRIEIFVEGEGLTDVEVISLPHGSRALEIVREIAEKSKMPIEEVFLFTEDGDEPLDLELIINEERARHTVHHVHRSKQIVVVVHYNSQSKEKRFPPSARVQRVLSWAVGKEGFDIDPAIAPEMELSLHGEEKALPKSAHIGRYAKHGHSLSLDLIRGIVPNG